jgi:hypothetical protein
MGDPHFMVIFSQYAHITYINATHCIWHTKIQIPAETVGVLAMFLAFCVEGGTALLGVRYVSARGEGIPGG